MITGQVTERGSERPLGAVQVSIPALQRGMITDGAGRYRIENLPAGTHEVQVQMLGYQTVTQTATVSAGSTATLDFVLASRAIALDEMVVTGVGTVSERRRLGQTIASIGEAEMQGAVAANMTEMLQGRVSGMVSQPMGEVGQSSPIRLRGLVSLSQRNEPLVYIDGVRMDNSTSSAANLARSPLNDVNMNDVERIEVIKGAAAATLYGTEASSGVIQITTRSGRQGPTQYNFEVGQQLSHLPHDWIPANHAWDAGGSRILTNAPARDFLRVGYQQSYALSAQGGSDGMQYYASARWMDESGVLPVNNQENMAARASMNFQHTDRLESRLSLGLTRNVNQVPEPGWGLVGEFVLSNPTIADETRPYGELFNTIHGALADAHHLTNDHTTLSAQVSYRWADGVRSSLQVGYNRIEEDRVRSVVPGVAIREMGGLRQLGTFDRTSLTFDGSTSWDWEVNPALTSSLVIGGQAFFEEQSNSNVGVRDFPSAGLGTLRGGSSVYLVDEAAEQVINAGVFLQEQIGLRNRLFITGGLRVDGNSAFGENFGFQAYPKLGVSWVASEHEFWNLDQRMGWDQLRLRFAYGTSGLQPGAFDAQRTWSPQALLNNDPAVLPLNLGNADLKPERSIETEFAAELEMLEGRLGAEVVYFRQRTEDALLATPFPPSQGFLNTQLTNVGRLESSGWELSVDWRVVQRPGFSWSVHPSFSYLDQKVADMGGVENFRVTGGRRWSQIAEGYAPGAVIAPIQDPSNPYTVSGGIENLTSLSQISPNLLQSAAGGDSLVFIGNATPPINASLSTTFELPRNISVRALFAGAADFVMSNETELIRDAVAVTPRAAEFNRMLADPGLTTEQRQRIADTWGGKHNGVPSSWMEDADFIRFQELMITHQVNDNLADRLGLSVLNVSVGARNLALWTKYSGMNDPGTTTTNVPTAARSFVPNIDYFGQPLPRRFVFQVRGRW